jgi:hypothetical protein
LSVVDWPQNLWDPQVSASDADRRPVAGAMAHYIGHQYSEEELWQYYRNHADVHPREEPELRPLARRIRAFDIPNLTDVTFRCRRLGDLALALEQVLIGHLPGTTWEPFDRARPRGIIKYAIIHKIVMAPVDEATQEAMVLELFGRLETLNGERVGIGWYSSRWPENPPDDDVDIGEMDFRLMRGTYANTRVPGVGVPFYM